ncbi:hypothetical protein BGX30_001183 [Mortierella sp. GBA39]|nr:hypothetical protein BGX30_001183 [Mortierella sp. GBA39]
MGGGRSDMQRTHGVNNCRKEAREQLWKPRYEKTVRWEEENNITSSMKCSRTTKDQRARWIQIYGWQQIYGGNRERASASASEL